MNIRTKEQWWDWHDSDEDRRRACEDSREAVSEAERLCKEWVSGESDYGPDN